MNKRSYTLRELAEITGSSLKGNADHLIGGVADLAQAASEDISFLANPRYTGQLEKTSAGGVIIASEASHVPHLNLLINPEPSKAIQTVAELFAKDKPPFSGFLGIHSTAVIHPEAQIAENVSIGPYVVVDKSAKIGARTVISSHVYIGPETTIGEDCLLHPHVTVREGCIIGNRVILQPGVVIGSCGFGYITSATGVHTKLEHFGNVVIEDDVEIGANSTIDRARFKQTKIGKGTKIDNLVMVGHNVEIGQHVILVAQTGIAGSTSLGDHCTIAGHVAIAGHLKIAPMTRVAGKSGVTKSLPSGDFGGIPAQPLQEYNKNSVYLRKMPEFVEEIKQLKKEIEELKAEKKKTS